MLSAIISVVTFAYLFITSTAVLLKGPKKAINVTLASGLFTIDMWLIGVVGLLTGLGGNILYGRMVFVFAALGMESLHLFAYYVASSAKVRGKWFLPPRASGTVAGIIVLLAASPLVLKSVRVLGDGKLPVPGFGVAYPVFVLWLIYIVVSVPALLVKAHTAATGKLKNQMQVILLGLTLFVVISVMTNAILPQIIHTTEIAKFAPLSVVLLASSLSYAVLKHRFLDIRLIVARSVAYVLSLASLLVMYVLVIFGVSALFSGSGSVDWGKQLAYIIPAAILAFTYSPLKRFFDRNTNKYFYRDAYDAQDFLDQLNNVLVSTIEAEELLARSAALIGVTIKSDFCTFIIRAVNGRPQRIIGDGRLKLDKEGASLLYTYRSGLGKVVVADDLSDEHTQVRDFLQKNNIGVLARLNRTSQGKDEALGYLLLGVKKSGNPYSRQDIKTIEIVTDELTIAIQNTLRFEEIENFNIKLKQEVEDATRKLRASNEKLKALDETKDEFISMASHQLRTPLTSVKGYVSMVLEGDAGKVNDMQKKLLNQAFVSSQRMVFLIADLLNVSRLKTGKFVLDTHPTNLAEVTAGEITQLTETAQARELKLHYEKPANFPLLTLDETKTRQVIMNFIDNAIYYTPSGGNIWVTLTDTPTSVEFKVTDDGIGVPKHEQHHLFTKFFRADNAKKARPDGTGLGLFMAKKVIVAQGGAIIFHSQEGKGSTFGFTFPKDKLVVTAASPIAAKMRVPAKPKTQQDPVA